MKRCCAPCCALCWVAVLLSFALLSGCGGGEKSVKARETTAYQLIENGAMRLSRINTPDFSLLSAYRFSEDASPLTVYLEGDGRAWASRYRLSADPTPLNPLALRLAAVHLKQLPQSPVAWLGRPCQYQSDRGAAICDPKYWSSHRFSEEVVESMSYAVDHLKAKSGATRVNLVGFSGGGAIAVLLAVRRSDVERVVTVAGNLDHDWVNGFHGVTPLKGSLSPISVAKQLWKMPQIHFIGENDGTIPGEVATRFIAQGQADLCARKLEVVGVSHTEGWVEQWDRLIEIVEAEPGCI